MKKYIILSALVICTLNCFPQSSNLNSILIRHDTTLLKAAECKWIIKSLTKNDPALTSEIGTSIPQIILRAIAEGKLKAMDRVTNKPIPAKEIYKWRMPKDTVQQPDKEGNFTNHVVAQRLHNSDNITEIRIYNDWYANVSTGKLQSFIKAIELMEEVHSAVSGDFIGYTVLCRIYY
jgi:hypothetical protein